MGFLSNKCKFVELSSNIIGLCEHYSCSRSNAIEEFFKGEYSDYSKQLLGKSYCFTTVIEDKNEMVCAFTVANSSIKISDLPTNKRNKLNRHIPNEKRRYQYPAVLIGQLAVFDKFKGMNIGRELLNFIKSWFIEPYNKTGCRYVIVDAINNENVLSFYRNNGFDFLFSSDEEESVFLSKRIDKYSLNTRLMYSDLILLKPQTP